MKHFYTRALMLLLALTWLVPKANAAGYEYTVTAASDWGQTFTSTQLTGSQSYFSAAVSNNWMYSVPAPTATNMMKYAYSDPDYAPRIFRLLTAQEYFTFPTNANYFPYPGYKGGSITSFSGYFYMGPAHAADTKGNLYFSHYSVDASAYGDQWANPIGAITAFSVNDRPKADASNSYLGNTSYKYQSNATPTTIILDPTYNGTVPSSATNYRITYRSDVMSAYGDGLGGIGYLWFAPNNGGDDVQEIYDKIECIILNSGKITDKKIFNIPEVNTTRSRVVQYADNKLLYNNQKTGKLYKGTLNASSVADASSVTWTDLGLINQGTGATMFMLAGREILVYSPTFDESATSFRIIDVTDINNMQVIGAYTPFTTASGANQTRAHFINVSNVDNYNANIYIFVPKVGTEKYTINAKAVDPVTDLVAELKSGRDNEQPERLDAVLTWNAPANGTVSSYTIYRRMNPWYSYELNAAQDGLLGQQNTWSEWEVAGTSSSTTFADLDLTMWHSSSRESERLYEYKVVPTFADGGIGAESDIVQVSAYLVPFIPRWDIEKDQDDIKHGIDRYDGYCKVQLYWKFPQVNNYQKGATSYKNVYGMKPDYYSVLRDGKTIATNINAYNYIDLDVKSDKEYSYKVVSHYNSFPNDTAVSTPNTVKVDKRDWAKVGYELTEIYNYKIATEEGTTPADSVVPLGTGYTNFSSTGSYKQGVYYDGYWYIAQRQDGATSATGGVIKISAAAPWENTTENILTPGTKILSGVADSNVGIASDEEGNLFVQSGTLLLNGTTTSTLWYNRMAKGTIYINNGNGTYTAYTVDFAGNGINFADGANAYEKGYQTTVPGRSEYYSMKGNIKTDGEAYLYVAPFQSKTVFVIKLTYNGSSVVPSIHAQYIDDGISSFTGEEFRYNNENYAFPVLCEGRENEFIYQIRSSAYSAFACHDDSDRAAGRITTVYDTQSRVNSAGGCTLEFNGELFIITPQSQYSANTGNFYVGMAERKGTNSTPATANLSHIIPVDMWTQADAESGVYSSMNSVWLYAEVGENDVNLDGQLNDYAYIYMYSPFGKRFAKYRLTPSSAFPPSQVTLKIEAKYAEDYVSTDFNPGGDITQFDATASWTEVIDYGVTSGGNVYYQIKGYTLELVNEAGKVVDGYPIIEFDVDENGKPTTVYTVTYNEDGVKIRTAVTIDSDVYKNLSWEEVTRTDENGNVVTDINGNEIKDIVYSYVYSDVEKDVDYTAQVTVNYVGVDESNSGIEQKSVKTEYEDASTYNYVAPSGNVKVVVDEDRWGDWDVDYQGNPANGSTKDPDDAYYDNYRVCFDIDNPDFDGARVEPVTNYTISYKEGDNVVQRNEFNLYVGLEEGEEYVITNSDGTTTKYTVDHDGYIKITNGEIPGDYNFDIATGGKPHVYWDMQDYTSAPGYDDEVVYTEDNNPSKWDYIVTANYAANNTRISESAPATMGTDGSGITTDVEIISVQSRLNVYPIPATVSVTIKCSEAIETVEIYSTSGLLVKTVEGNADQMMTVDVSDLASGYYFMRVNNLSPVKIMKH